MVRGAAAASSVGGDGARFGDPGPGKTDVLLVGVVADVVTPVARGRNRGRTRTQERVEDDVVDVAVEADEPFRQLDRERRRVLYPASPFRADLPHVERRREELLLG